MILVIFTRYFCRWDDAKIIPDLVVLCEKSRTCVLYVFIDHADLTGKHDVRVQERCRTDLSHPTNKRDISRTVQIIQISGTYLSMYLPHNRSIYIYLEHDLGI